MTGPVIHIHGSTADAHAASFSLVGNAYTDRVVAPAKPETSVMHINLLNMPGVNTALREMGVQTRKIGSKEMQPAAKSLVPERMALKGATAPIRPRFIDLSEPNIGPPVYAFAA